VKKKKTANIEPQNHEVRFPVGKKVEGSMVVVWKGLN